MLTKEVEGTSQEFLLQQGTCFGFRVCSEIPFECLRDGSGSELRVFTANAQPAGGRLQTMMEWTEQGAERPYARLYRTQHRYWLWTSGVGWSVIEPEVPRITLPYWGDPSLREELLWTVPAALCLLHRRDLVLHAGAVEVDGQAILLGAAGHAGKSTLAAAFAQAGCRMLSEDVSCIRMDAHPSVIPGPAMLRLRPDVLTHLTLPKARVLRRTPSRLTLALDPTRRGTCDPLPLRAVVLLEPSTDGFALERLPAQEGMRRLWSLTFRTPVDQWLETCFAQLAALAARVPILTFARPLQLQALPATVEYLATGAGVL